MSYIKLYEGFFEEREKLENKFLNDLEDFLPDVLNIDGLTKKLTINNDSLLFRLTFNKEQKISDISNILSYDLKMMDNLLSNDYNILYCFHCVNNGDNFGRTNIKINDFINLLTDDIEEIEFYNMKYIMIFFNKKPNFKKFINQL